MIPYKKIFHLIFLKMMKILSILIDHAELASIDQLINNFKKGFDHNLGESGLKFPVDKDKE